MTRIRDQRTRTRNDDDAGAPPSGADTTRIDETRERARRLLDASDDIIARALSADSASFLADNRQAGGQ